MPYKPNHRPPRLAPGTRVALIAPSGPLLERDDLTRGTELCRALGLEPVLFPHAAARHGYLAGTDAQRLGDLNAALRDPAIGAVWCLRGGYGLTRIIDAVDFQALADHPKAILGYSDVTVLLLAAAARAGVVTFHAPTARAPMPAFTRRAFERVLFHADTNGPLELPRMPDGVLVPRAPRVITLRGGVAEGPLLGGNLSLVAALAGSALLPSFDGAILFLEDVGEALYRIDRLLSQLRLAGVLGRLAGVAVGHFTELARGTPDGAMGLDEVLDHYLTPLGVPAAFGFPIGHMDEQWTLPLGVRARLDADAGELTLLEPGVL